MFTNVSTKSPESVQSEDRSEELVKKFFNNRIRDSVDVILHIDGSKLGSNEFEKDVKDLVENYVEFYGDFFEKPSIFFNLCVTDALGVLALDGCNDHWVSNQYSNTDLSYYDEGTVEVYKKHFTE